MQPYQFRNGGRNAVLLRWRPASAQFTIRMEYKGVECTAELALTPDMIEHLVLEAEFRNLRIGELIRDLILSTVKNDLFRLVYGA